MTIGLVGAIVAAAGFLGLILSRRGLFVAALAASAALPATAALSTTNASVAPFYVLGIIATIGAVGGIAHHKTALSVAWKWLILFGAVSIFVTLIAPNLFAGQLILLPDDGVDQAVLLRQPLAYNSGIFAQVAYLILGLGIAAFVAINRLSARLAEVAFVAGIGGSSLRFAWERMLGQPWPNDQFQNFVGASYNPYETRFYGVFPEPSVLAVFAIAAATYYTIKLSRSWTWGSAAMAALSLLSLLVSESGTAALTATIIAGGLALLYLAGFLFGGRRVHPLGPPAIGLAVVALLASPLAAQVLSLVSEKSISQSATARFAADRLSIDIAADTYWIGVGLGANRPSSFATMLLSTVGFLGLLIFIVAMWRLLKPALTARSALGWSLLGLLTAKVVADPNLSTPLLWLLIGLVLAEQASTAESKVASVEARPTRGKNDTDTGPVSTSS